MRIGYDHATIALVTLDNKKNTASDRGRLVRAMARLYASKAAFEFRTDCRPRPDAPRNTVTRTMGSSAPLEFHLGNRSYALEMSSASRTRP
jgi:hypothetical protein